MPSEWGYSWMLIHLTYIQNISVKRIRYGLAQVLMTKITYRCHIRTL